VSGGVVVYVAGKPEAEWKRKKLLMSLWVYFVHGLLLGLFLTWLFSWFGKK
jgi:hypothetical protein